MRLLACLSVTLGLILTSSSISNNALSRRDLLDSDASDSSDFASTSDGPVVTNDDDSSSVMSLFGRGSASSDSESTGCDPSLSGSESGSDSSDSAGNPCSTSSPSASAPDTDIPTTAAPTTPAPETTDGDDDSDDSSDSSDSSGDDSDDSDDSDSDSDSSDSGSETPAPAVSPSTPTPVTTAPSTPVPVTTAPSTPAPVTPAPSTPAPVTTAPSTPAPVTIAPSTPAPITPAPTTLAPTTAAPTTTSASPTSASSPTTGSPTTGSPTTGSPTTGSPTTSSPSISAPSGEPTPAPTVDTAILSCDNAEVGSFNVNYSESFDYEYTIQIEIIEQDRLIFNVTGDCSGVTFTLSGNSASNSGPPIDTTLSPGTYNLTAFAPGNQTCAFGVTLNCDVITTSVTPITPSPTNSLTALSCIGAAISAPNNGADVLFAVDVQLDCVLTFEIVNGSCANVSLSLSNVSPTPTNVPGQPLTFGDGLRIPTGEYTLTASSSYEDCDITIKAVCAVDATDVCADDAEAVRIVFDADNFEDTVLVVFEPPETGRYGGSMGIVGAGSTCESVGVTVID